MSVSDSDLSPLVTASMGRALPFDETTAYGVILNTAKSAELRTPRSKRHRRHTGFCFHQRSCVVNSMRGFLKGFLWGYGIKGGVAFLSLLLFRKGYRRPLQALVESFGADSLRFSLVFCGFTGGFRGLQCLMRRLRQKDDRWNAFVAGSVSSLALLFDTPDRQHTWVLWTLARGLDLMWRSGTNRGILPDVPEGESVTFILGSAVIMHAWLLHRDCLPHAYHAWITDRGGCHVLQLDAVKDIVNGDQPQLNAWCALNKIPLYDVQKPVILPCHVLHPMEPNSCWWHAILRWFIGFKTAVPIYSVVHVLPLLLFRFKSILSPTALLKTLVSIATSSAFITTFQFYYWLMFCYSRRVTLRDSRLTSWLAALAAGFSIFVEKRSRRLELTLFVLPRAIDTAWKMMKKTGYVSSVKHAQSVIFALTMGMIMTFYQHENEVIKPTYYKLLHRYFGTN